MSDRIHPYATVAVALVAALCCAGGAAATTYFILDDGDDLTQGNGTCTLREAAYAASSDVAFDDCPAGSSDEQDVIVLLVSPIVLTLPSQGNDFFDQGGDIDLSFGELAIVGGLIPGVHYQVVGGPLWDDRIFEIFQATVEIVGLEIAGGDTRSAGGGIMASDSVLSIVDSKVRFNEAEYGGGIALERSFATIERTSVIANSTGIIGWGAGLYINDGSAVTVVDSLFWKNHAAFGGGAIALCSQDPASECWGNADPSSLVLSRSWILENTGQNGGGLVAAGGVGIVENSIFSHNRAFVRGGGLYFTETPFMAVDNTTIVDNRCDEGCDVCRPCPAGGIAVFDTGEAPVGVEMTNTILANNQATGGGPDCTGPITSEGHNLLGDLGGCGLAPLGTDLVGVDPRVQSDDGYRPHFDSPAVDAGDPATCKALDFYRVARPQDGDGDGEAVCDIGAVERGPSLFADGFETGHTGNWSSSVG